VTPGTAKAIRALRAWLGACGIALLGAALAWAPIAAFDGDMSIVSELGIAGVALVLVAWLLSKVGRAGEGDEAQGDNR
jgi:hypothetical protein